MTKKLVFYQPKISDQARQLEIPRERMGTKMPLQIRDRLGYLNEYGTPRIERNEDNRNENRNPCVFLSLSQFACFFPPFFFQKRESELPHPSAISSPLGFSQLERQQGQSTNFYEVRSQTKGPREKKTNGLEQKISNSNQEQEGRMSPMS